MEVDVEAMTSEKDAREKQADEALRRQIVEKAEEALRDVKCPDHGKNPQVAVSGPLKELRIHIKACCEKARDLGTEALEEVGIVSLHA